MNLASRIATSIAGFGIVVGVSAVGIALALLIAIAIFGVITALWAVVVWAVVVWAVWNLAAPMFAFVPVEYQTLGFLQVWGAVAVIRVIGRVLFGSFKKGNKQ